MEAAEVEVALKTAAVGEEVEMTLPEESVARSWSLPREVAPVPPWDTGRVPIREPLERERQVLEMAKQPVRMLRPEPKVLVAVGERLMELEPVPPIERKVPGVVVPRPRYPLASRVSAAVVEVAVPAVVVVAMYRSPPAFRKAH